MSLETCSLYLTCLVIMFWALTSCYFFCVSSFIFMNLSHCVTKPFLKCLSALPITVSFLMLTLDDAKVKSFNATHTAVTVKSVTSLGQRTKKSGTMSMMQQKVTQKTTSERLNTLRSPEGRPQHTETHMEHSEYVLYIPTFRHFRTS